MTAIKVALRAPTKAGRLYPRYDPEAHVLAAESCVRRSWPYAINVDATLICDIDEERVLANIDLHYERDKWPVDPCVHWPNASVAYDLVVGAESLAERDFEGPVEVKADKARTVVQITVSSSEPDRTAALSDKCIALLAEAELVGFIMRVETE